MTDAQSDWHLMEHCPDSYVCVCLCVHLTVHMLKSAKDQRNVTDFGTSLQSALSGNVPPQPEAPGNEQQSAIQQR